MGYYLGLQSTMLRDVKHTLNLCLAKDRVNASRVNFRKFTRSDRCQSARIHAASTENQSLKLFSPAKINVFLRVVRRREDGYHDLASLFHVIDLGDDMEFSLLPSGSSADALQCNMPDVPTDSSNLVIKALDLFRRKTGASERWSVNLLKRVPAGAGMGGGSGNAATALWAANEMCGRPATTEQLLEWAGDIGSDISVFFSRGAAYCTGRGEIVEDIDPPLPLDTPLLLVKPPIGLSTPEIFKALDLSRRSTRDPRELLEDLARNGVQQELCVNDLEQPAFDRLPALMELKKRLRSTGQFSAVFMTGSGSTIVGMGNDQAPDFLAEPQYGGLFVSPARLIVRQPEGWYEKNSKGSAKVLNSVISS